MAEQDPDPDWLPRLGDRVRVKTSGFVGEVVAAFTHSQREWCILSFAMPAIDDPHQALVYARELSQARASYSLEDLEPAD